MAAFLDSIYFAFILLVVGFVLLIKGADFFVEGSSGIAKKLRVPSIIIGLTVVAMGTSLPEAAVSVSAGLAGSNSLAISNVLGSNIFNLMVVVGFCAVMAPIVVDKDMIKRDIPISIGAALLLLLLGLWGMTLGRVDAILLLVLFIAFIVFLVFAALKNRTAAAEEEDEIKARPIWLCLIFIVGGAAAIIFGGDWVVDSATKIALTFGMSETLVGLTIVSIGTSLPEFVTSIVAARKKEVELSLGNAIGSNVFNILLILGLSGTISPLAVLTENIIDVVILIAFSAFVWFAAWKKKKLGRLEGILMILFYVAFVVYIGLR
jgi:cation:H+ antiporter